MLSLIDKRLRQAFPENKNKPFGGRSIIMFRDFGQLPPVLDLPMYTTNTSWDITSNDGIACYKQFREVYKLDVVQRQSGNSDTQKSFREILIRLRDGECTLDDWKRLTSRFEEKLSSIEKEGFKEEVSILTKWIDVDRVNEEMLRSLKRPVAKIRAEHTGKEKQSKPVQIRQRASKLNCYWRKDVE